MIRMPTSLDITHDPTLHPNQLVSKDNEHDNIYGTGAYSFQLLQLIDPPILIQVTLHPS